jgi:hypothetical protein
MASPRSGSSHAAAYLAHWDAADAEARAREDHLRALYCAGDASALAEHVGEACLRELSAPLRRVASPYPQAYKLSSVDSGQQQGQGRDKYALGEAVTVDATAFAERLAHAFGTDPFAAAPQHLVLAGGLVVSALDAKTPAAELCALDADFFVVGLGSSSGSSSGSAQEQEAGQQLRARFDEVVTALFTRLLEARAQAVRRLRLRVRAGGGASLCVCIFCVHFVLCVSWFSSWCRHAMLTDTTRSTPHATRH